MQLASTKVATQKLVETPYLFGEVRTSASKYLAIPKVSSENRLFHFGIITSHMLNAWKRTVCGRLKSDYRYANNIVYNNFPWPDINVG